MILTSQWLSHVCTWKILDVFNGIRTHGLYDAGALLLSTELLSHSYVSGSICWPDRFPWKEWWVKEMFVKCGCEMNWRNDPHNCWMISVIVSYVHLKIFGCLQLDSTTLHKHFFNSLFLSREHTSPTVTVILVAWFLSWRGHCTGIKEIMGSNPVEYTWKISGVRMRQSLEFSSKCEDHFFNSLLRFLV